MRRGIFFIRPYTQLISLFCLMTPVIVSGGAPPDRCQECHESAGRMKELGYPHFTVTQREVERQTGMPATCTDCHLGNPGSAVKEEAHRGMGRLSLVMKKGLKAETSERKLPLEMGTGPVLSIKYRVEKSGKILVDPSVNTILYQDKRLDDLSQDFPFIEKTCGKCHADELAEFRKSAMGRNAKQSRYKSWVDREHGPHNCGVWFGDNCPTITGDTAVPFPKETCALNQRSCNTCHVGCLDCHYFPSKGDGTNPAKGMHTFNKKPEPASCYGGGRGTLCHSGPEERRRGAGYFGGNLSFPEGMPPDIHLANKVGCLDCHDNSGTGKGLGHGVVKRQANCEKCHGDIFKSHGASIHARLTCEACHIQNVAGYQATFWGPGKLAGADTPYYKYNGYYGVMKEPILIKDRKGRWIPVKPYPMAVMNQKKSDLKPGLHWRYPAGLPDLERTDDAWGYAGLVEGLPENNRALLWIQMDKLSHKYGRSRSCDSCHESVNGEQRQDVSWEYSDQGAFPFKGSHTVIAGKKGLFIRDIKGEEPIEVSEGYKLSAFAPWAFLKGNWSITGDFSLPEIKNRKNFEKQKADPANAKGKRVMHGLIGIR